MFKDIGRVSFIRDEPLIPDEEPDWLTIFISLLVLIVLFTVAVVLIHLFYKKRREKIMSQTTIRLIESLRRLNEGK